LLQAASKPRIRWPAATPTSPAGITMVIRPVEGE
jgi:hypothetical protein